MNTGHILFSKLTRLALRSTTTPTMSLKFNYRALRPEVYSQAAGRAAYNRFCEIGTSQPSSWIQKSISPTTSPPFGVCRVNPVSVCMRVVWTASTYNNYTRLHPIGKDQSATQPSSIQYHTSQCTASEFNQIFTTFSLILPGTAVRRGEIHVAPCGSRLPHTHSRGIHLSAVMGDLIDYMSHTCSTASERK